VSRNKIGIEVQVEFPTIKNLQEQISNKFDNKAKILVKLGVSQESFRELKTQIQNVFDRSKEFKINIDTASAISDLKKVQEKVEYIDKILDRKRTLNIDLNIKDMDKTLKEVFQNAKQESKNLTESTKRDAEERRRAVESEARAFENLGRNMAKVEEIVRNKGSEKEARTYRYTEDLGQGMSRVTTLKPNGEKDEHDIADYAKQQRQLEQQRKAELSEIEDYLKRQHDYQMKIVNATGEHKESLIRQKALEREVAQNLMEQYKSKHNMNALDDQAIRELLRRQSITLQNAKLVRQQRDDEQELASAISKVTQLESKKQQLARQIVSATEEEAQWLRKQYDHYDDIQKKLIQKHDVMNKMTAEQKEELENIRRIGFLQRENAQAKEREKALAQQAREEEKKRQKILSELQGDLRKVHQIELQIQQIKNRQLSSGESLTQQENARLNVLQRELQLARNAYEETRNRHKAEGNVTEEMREQLRVQTQVHQREKERANDIARVQGQQDKVANALREHERIQTQINQLNRDLIFSGMREEVIIQRQVSELQRRQRESLEALRAEGLITQEIEQQIRKTQQLARAQNEANRQRQDARERDRAFNDTGGVVDPYSVYNNFEQGFREIVENMRLVDEQFMRVAKVAEASTQALQTFKEESYDTASSLGVSADEYMKAVETWVTAGKTFQESQELAQISLIGSFVGNIEPDLMVKWMSVPLNAFKEAGLEANDVINIMNETSNNHAVEMQELGKAYMRSSGSIKNAGVTFEELTGLITGAQEATRMGGERIGTALKTIGINYNNIKGQITTGEAKKFDMLKGFGIDLEKTDNLMEALEIVASKSDELSDVEMNEILYRLAGKEHQNILAGIIDQWEVVNQSIDRANQEIGLGEKGSAYEEFDKQKNSVRFQLAELKNAWMELMNTIGESDGAVSKILEGLVQGLQKASDLASNDKFMDALKFIAIGVAIHGITNGVFRMTDAFRNGFGGAMRNAKDLLLMMDGLKRKTTEVASSARNLVTRNRGANGNNGSGSDSDRDRNGRGSNSSQDVIVTGGTGGRNNRDRDRNRDEQDDNDRRRRLEETEQSADRVDGKMAKLGKTVGKVVSLIPFIGDALLIAELAGVPVLDTMGKMFDGIVETQKEAVEEQKKLNEEFVKGNDLMNGKLDDATETTGNLRGQFEGIDTDKEKDGVQGYMDVEQFRKFKEEFNAQVEELNLGADFKINMNDTTHIQEQLDKLDKKLKELKQQEAIDISEKIGGDVSKVAEARTQISGLKAEQEYLAQATQKAKDEMEKLKVNGKVPPENIHAYNYWAGELSRLESRSKNVNDTLKTQEETLKTSKTAMAQKAQAILQLGDSFDATKVKAENQKDTLTAMYVEMNKLEGTLKKTSSAQGILKKNTNLTNDQFQEILSLVPQAKKKYGDYSVEAVNANKDVRAGLEKVINKEHEKANASVQSGRKAVTAMENATVATQGSKKALEDASKKAKDLGQKVKDIPANKKVKADVEVTGIKWLDKVINFFNRSWSKTVSVDVTGKDKSKSVAIGSGTPSIGKSISANVASGLPVLGTGSTSNNSAVNKATSSKSSTPPHKISQDVWRYWGIEEYGLGRIEKSLSSVERQLQDANENYDKMISLYKQQQSLLKSQIAEYRKLKSAKDSEINSVLGQLSKYGFRVNTGTNTISNLSHSKNLSGDKAQKAEELLNKWKSLYNELDNIDNTIASIEQNYKKINDSIKQANISKELKAWEKYLKGVESLMTSIGNKESIFNKKIGFASSKDSEFALVTNEQAMNDAKGNLTSLISQFNKLSKANIAYEENGTTLKATLDKLGQEILQQADAIIKYQEAINEIEFNRVIQDLNEFNSALDVNQSRIDNNIKNLKEGLLSGTDFGDLISSKTKDLLFNRNNELEQSAQDRINLELEVQQALDGFAKKNIDRQSKIANSTLEIESKKFNQMLKMAKDYSQGQKASYKEIQATFEDLASVGKLDESYTFIKELDDSFDELREKQDALTKKYSSDMAKALTSDERDNLTNQYIIDSLKMQEEYFKASIEANENAITELENQLKDSTLTDEQVEKIQAQIDSLEKENIDSQNKIKDAIKDRFDFEFELLEEALSKYDKYADELNYSMDIIKTLGEGNYDAQGVIMDNLLSVEKARNAEIAKTLSSLEEQLSMYEVGSYEWQLIDKQVEEYHKLLQDSNLELLDMNKNIMSNSFDSTINKLEKELFDGKTIEQFKDYHDLWMTGLEREIALEELYQRLTDLGTTAFNEKMALLDKQEKLSRFEMDYLNKQLDVLELQQKLENLNKEKTVQTLKQKADGTWDWVYEADATKIADTEKELADAKLELEKAEQEAREEFVDGLDKILENAEKGQYETIEDFRNAIDELSDAYESIVGDFPQIKEEYLNELINAYAKYIEENGDVLDGIITDTGIAPQEVFNGLSDEIVKAFNSIGKDIGETFAKALIEELPRIGIPIEKPVEQKSVSINLDKVEFPNIKTADGIKDAILSLPQIALQKSKEKL
jgi:TP901 family phage tail tape measure protein